MLTLARRLTRPYVSQPYPGDCNWTLTVVTTQYAEIDRQTSRAKSNVEAYTKDAKAEAIKAVDKFDAKVEEGAAKAKGGISSWFGGSK